MPLLRCCFCNSLPRGLTRDWSWRGDLLARAGLGRPRAALLTSTTGSEDTRCVGRAQAEELQVGPDRVSVGARMAMGKGRTRIPEPQTVGARGGHQGRPV